MRETIEGAIEEFVAGDRKRDSAPSFAADDDEASTDNRTMLEWPPKPRTPSADPADTTRQSDQNIQRR